MVVIADSGSTKADWQFLDANGTMTTLSTMGFNPNYHSKEFMVNILEKDLKAKVAHEEVLKVFFYGSGCSDDDRKYLVKNALSEIFENATIEVNHDLLASARATCGNRPGIACIMGTGSNSILYDGEKEIDNIPSLGHLLADEGSGNHLGKKLVRAYFFRELPEDLHKKMDEFFPDGKKDLLDNIYGVGAAPATYFAKFSRFYSDTPNHPFLEKILYESFEEFLAINVCKYENYENLTVNFVGSIAHYFESSLRKVMEDKKLNMGIILKQPIYNLVKFHLERGDIFE